MSSTAQAVSHPGTGTHAWNRRARFFNSGNAFALNLSPVPSVSFIAERDRAFDPATPTGLIDMDLSASLKLPFPATTPLVLSRYAVIRTGDTLPVQVRASTQLLCILEGRGSTAVAGEAVQWKAGDVLVLPGAARAEHNAMALTLCLQGEGCHSLVDGERKNWSRHAVMVTPPGAAHSHHNEGSRRMESWVVQDGGLHYHARTTGFAYAD